jgi:type I restriction enzyme S subunit
MGKIKLVDICNPKQWKTIPTSELLEAGYPVYGANGIIGYYSAYNHENPVVAVTCRGATCGTINITVPKAYVTGNAMCLDDVRSDIDTEYLYYCLKHYDFNNVISGSAQPQITRQGMDKIYITIGKHDEQISVVNILKRVEKLIELRRKELTTLDDLIKARFVELFEKKEYPVEKLSNVCLKITDGTHKTPNYLDDGVTFISAKNIVNGELDFTDIKHISEEEYQEIQKRCQTEMFDILLSKSGSLGSPVIVKTTEKLGLFESLAVIKYDRDKLLPEFLCEQLKSDRIQRQFTIGTKGVAIKHLHLGVIGDTDIIVPPIEVQQQFADFVAQVDKSKLKGEIVSKYRKYGRANC